MQLNVSSHFLHDIGQVKCLDLGQIYVLEQQRFGFRFVILKTSHIVTAVFNPLSVVSATVIPNESCFFHNTLLINTAVYAKLLIKCLLYNAKLQEMQISLPVLNDRLES